MKLLSESHQWALEPKLKLPHNSFLSRIHSFIHWDISSLRAGIFVGCDPHCVPGSQNSPDTKEAVYKHSFKEWMVGSVSIFSSHLMTIDVGNFNRGAAQWKRPKTQRDLCAYEHCGINEWLFTSIPFHQSLNLRGLLMYHVEYEKEHGPWSQTDVHSNRGSSRSGTTPFTFLNLS